MKPMKDFNNVDGYLMDLFDKDKFIPVNVRGLLEGEAIIVLNGIQCGVNPDRLFVKE